MQSSESSKKELEYPTILLPRHQKTKWNKGGDEDRLKGTEFDLPLTSEGQKEAEKLATVLGRYNIKSINRSKMLRNEQSIRPLEETAKIKAAVVLALDPWDIGYLSGHKRTEAEDRIHYYIRHPDKVVPEGQSYNDFWEAFTNFLATEMKYADAEGLRIDSTHSCDILAAEAFINGEEPRPHVGKMPPPGSITAIEKKHGKWSLRHDWTPETSS